MIKNRVYQDVLVRLKALLGGGLLEGWKEVLSAGLQCRPNSLGGKVGEFGKGEMEVVWLYLLS